MQYAMRWKKTSAMLLLLLIKHEKQSTFWNDRHLLSFQQTFGNPTAQISEPAWLQKMERNAAAGLPSSWRLWTKAALDQYLMLGIVLSSVINDARDK